MPSVSKRSRRSVGRSKRSLRLGRSYPGIKKSVTSHRRMVRSFGNRPHANSLPIPMPVRNLNDLLSRIKGH